MHYMNAQSGGSKHNYIDFSLMATNNDISFDLRREKWAVSERQAHPPTHRTQMQNTHTHTHTHTQIYTTHTPTHTQIHSQRHTCKPYTHVRCFHSALKKNIKSVGLLFDFRSAERRVWKEC